MDGLGPPRGGIHSLIMTSTIKIRLNVFIDQNLKRRIRKNLERDKNAKWKGNRREIARKLEAILWKEGKHSPEEYSDLSTLGARLRMIRDEYLVVKKISKTKIA